VLAVLEFTNSRIKQCNVLLYDAQLL
jgi:hypothetical protein